MRFNDQFALLEIDHLLEEITQEVSNQVELIGAQGARVHRVSTIATILLCTLLLPLVFQRSKKIRDLKTIQQLNDKLSESNASLAGANTSLKQFAGIVSHDLRTPLRHVGFFMSLIEEEIDEPFQRLHTMDSAYKGVRHWFVAGENCYAGPWRQRKCRHQLQRWHLYVVGFEHAAGG